jgi:CMP-N-acetylneuraminic acid synthetase
MTAELVVANGARLAVIPARGGSKRVPGKNVRPLLGRPAIAYTVEAALESGLFAQVVVSTDSETIAQAARQAGAVVPFLRAEALADDYTPVSRVTLDALLRLDPRGGRFECVAQLMPNCPLRTAEDVRASYAQFVRTGAASQLSVTRYGWQNPWWAARRTERFELEPLFAQRGAERSQDLPELFCPTGAVWWATSDVLRREATFHVPGRTGWELSWERAVDIDTEADWQLAELLLQRSGAIAVPHAI